MYYRQKIQLSLIEFCGRKLSNTRLEKLLFLYSKKKIITMIFSPSNMVVLAYKVIMINGF